MMNMKKLRTILVVMAMSLHLVACGGPDTQPAIDAHTELTENYNKFVDYANADLESYSQDDIDLLNSCAAVIDDYGEKLSKNTEFTQEEIDEMVDMFDEFNGIIKEFLADYEK